MIFTGQVWNMTFSFYGSLRAIPAELREVALVHRFGWWKRFRTLEVPSAMIGLVWNSMMSMAGGWFFLTVNESFTLGDHDFRLAGIGSYMSVAIDRGDRRAMAGAVVAMVVMIVVVDQLLWRPLLAWAQRFKLEDTSASEVTPLVASRSVAPLAGRVLARRAPRTNLRGARAACGGPGRPARAGWRSFVRGALGWLVVGIVAIVVLQGARHLVTLLAAVRLREWLKLAFALLLTFLRTMAALAIGAAWCVPVGVWVGRSPARTRLIQPLVQIAASFPAPMIFPLATLAVLVDSA